MAKELNFIMKTLGVHKVEIESSKNQLAESMEMKDTTQEMKDTMETYNSRSQEAEENTQELENKITESLYTKEQRKEWKNMSNISGNLRTK